MKRAKNFVKKLFKNDDGATAVEYGIMVALIAGVIIGVVTTLGQSLDATFDDVATRIPAGGGGTP